MRRVDRSAKNGVGYKVRRQRLRPCDGDEASPLTGREGRAAAVAV